MKKAVSKAEVNVLHDDHVQAWREELEGIVGWYDETLMANHWAGLTDLSSTNAAMLLCQFNPNRESFDDAKLTTTDETGPDDLVMLEQNFSDLAKSEAKPRTLHDWYALTKAKGWKHHSWIDQYAQARGWGAEEVTTESSTRISANAEPKVHSTKGKRTGAMDEAIGQARNQCQDRNSVAQIWARLQFMSIQKPPIPPLMDFADGEIKYKKANGDIGFMNRESLAKRIKRSTSGTAENCR